MFIRELELEKYVAGFKFFSSSVLSFGKGCSLRSCGRASLSQREMRTAQCPSPEYLFHLT